MSDIFDPNVTFKDLGLHENVLQGVHEAGFKHPTDIQAKFIPAALTGKDLLGQARTGTGKTAAFGLPILSLADPAISQQALILVPTRELAAQVASELDELGKYTPIRTTCIIGGESMRDQVQSIKAGGHILVGTPGRIMDLAARRDINLDRIRFVVLDEVDRMLDIGFREDIRKILGSMKQDHQTFFVSATISEEIERLARSFMKSDAQRIVTASGSLTVSQVDQKYLPVEPWDKRPLLLYLLRTQGPDTTIVFCRTKATVHNLNEYLRDKGVDAREIHGDMPQQKRNRVMTSMRTGSLDVLVASDLAARGLDIDHISHVINYDLPEDPEVYVHRIGRTARAGRLGVAWSFVTPEEGQRLTEIEKLTGVIIEKLELPAFQPGPVPQDVAAYRQKDQQRRSQNPMDKITERARPIHEIDPNQASEEELKRMFPDGVIPKSMPAQSLSGKFRTKRRR